jgi:hypothetical protein
MLRDGRAAHIETATKGHPAVTEVTRDTDMRFVDLPQKTLDAGEERSLPSPMPAFFKGQNCQPRRSILACHHRQQDAVRRHRRSRHKTIVKKADLVSACAFARPCRKTPGSWKIPRSRCIGCASTTAAALAEEQTN